MLLADNGDLFGDTCGIAGAEDDTGLRVDEVSAQRASQQSLRQQCALPEAGLGVDLFLEFCLACRALELPVERLLDLGLTSELIFVSLNDSKSQLGIHLFERAHGASVAGRNN